ncbi:bifunctional glycosyltransferase family 2 protein/CDP-glycerol:glycerophosphate glycerophosphotransferase [Faecalicoccus pleomorphus]|uniref:bifunctional glycosyltransferase/CDP-glycerol:glycerophosphate glycerophosphotransferase n=1 Tax=Faecalicoccus pleomorphus TaxID=1323 RepID=UPI00232DF35D|nr:bifunctional glycosyltransferase family 2 protein/CDP-glycerol:glycerophosphate glycerophosphotransferase [Faecalicoccus pleomorphus]MDB7988157.1 bifunctional glycosyltransferase family 2 protein/CDP-glycerol:glycerophosphate glycerophosphotransferase [Faecalicoccus pleomorphus]MDB7992506.1 bifunctional glycosyltransferase family 2 protein/CDP-glycerol:glycerophosphate glycerophosphotransferase [Faecalicoccus pleomorphus]
MNKISIIIPFQKYLHYLKECLQSLKESSYQDFEVLIVCDHVDEHVQKEIPGLSDLSLRILSLEDETGVAACRNKGLQQATGEYVYFLDSDDYILEDTLFHMTEHLNGQDMVYGTIRNTWNNKANFLDKLSKKEIDADDEAEKMQAQEEKIQNHLERFKEQNSDRMLAIYHTMVKRSGFQTITVLSNLYRRQFLIDHQISFEPSFRYFSDQIFLVQVLEKAASFLSAEDGWYIKRKHNDPINEPSLNQEESDTRFEERCLAVECARKLIDAQGPVRYYLDKKLIRYVTKTMIKRIRRSQDERWRNEYFIRIQSTLLDTAPRVLDDLSAKQKRIILLMMKNDLKGVQKAIRWSFGKAKLKSIFANKNKNTLYKLAYYHHYLKMPIKENVVLFETFMAKNYSDSPKYIYEALNKMYPGKYECVWAINGKHDIPYGAKTIKRFSFQYAYYCAISKYLVFNVRQPLWFRKREGQVFLETWHGTPLKRLVFDQEEVTSASPKYKEQFYKQRKEWDYLVSANPFSSKTFRSCFMYEGKMLEYGYPRNDILYASDKEERAKRLKEKLGIPLDKKTILYAPTWRDDEHYGKGEYKFTLALDLKKMKTMLEKDYVLLLRTHHYIADKIDTTGLGGFAYNLSTYDDISEIYLITDICITDYSSVFFDFANLKRPILFYTYDIEKYKNQLRGFYIDMNTEVPGPLLYTSEEVIDAILHIDKIQKRYQKRYDEFYDRFCCFDDGHASENIVKEVFG